MTAQQSLLLAQTRSRIIINIFTGMAESALPQRHRRTNPKRKREEIYCYEEEFDRNDDSNPDSD